MMGRRAEAKSNSQNKIERSVTMSPKAGTAANVDVTIHTDQCYFLLRVRKDQGLPPRKDAVEAPVKSQNSSGIIHIMKGGTVIRRMIPTSTDPKFVQPDSVIVRPPQIAISLLTNTSNFDSTLSVDLIPIKNAHTLTEAEAWLYQIDGSLTVEAESLLCDVIFHAVITMSYEWTKNAYTA
jgi:hypothetical protein